MTFSHAEDPARASVVLLVDSHPDTLTLYEEYLSVQGVRVLTATNAQDALTIARARQPHAVCTSYRLELIDGAELTARLKADAATRAIPVVIHTAFISTRDLRRAREAGADTVLLKPLLPENLLNELRHLVQAARAAS
jgi:two-component system cell cycle response regulator DivK